ncbi:MAG: hypothetical protein Tsb009_21640 [Planctomycetaceae bacterium]
MNRIILFALLLIMSGILQPAKIAFAQEIRFVEKTHTANLLTPLAGLMGHGGAWGDFDGDGHIDLYVGGFADRPDAEYHPAKSPVGNALFRNLGNGRFERVKQPAVDVLARTSGAVFADLDNNGTLELYVANNAKPGRSRRKIKEPQRSAKSRRSALFRNDGGLFRDISESSGACPPTLHTARNIGVFDYNGDGLLDLLIIEDKFRRGSRSVLLKNLGSLKFQDVTKEAGLPDDIFGLGLAVADLNADGRPDFFVGHSNRFFLSTQSGKYTEPQSLKETFRWKPLHGEDWPCGAAFGDLNNDGKLDMVLAVHCETARNKIYLNEGLNNGIPQFRDVTAETGLPKSFGIKTPHVEIQDFDNDGKPDIYLSAGWIDEKGAFTPLIYQNQGNRNGIPQFKPPSNSRRKGRLVYFPAGPSGDFDNDGRIDLFLINWFQGNHSRLMQNQSPKRQWLNVRVVGKTINRMGIGSQVRIYAAGQKKLLGLQEISTGYGYASGQPAIAHFGLGNTKFVDVDVRLPNGKQIRTRKVSANQTVVIREP